MKILGKFTVSSLAVLGLVALMAVPVLALDKSEADLKVKESALVVEKFAHAPDGGSLRYLVKQCKAVAIFPNMVKAGFVLGGKFGRGVVLVRKADGSFGPPAFFTMGGATVGFQIGAQAADLILAIMNQKGLDGILHNQVKFGVDASVAAGPVGREAQAALSGASFKADIYSYSATQGAFAGATLEGAGIEYDDETTNTYYGSKKLLNQVLLEGEVKVPASGKALQEALRKVE